MIFLDSSYLIGLLIKSDDYYIKAHQLKPIIEYEKIMINNTVLTEVMNSLKLQNNAEKPSFDLDKIFNFLSNSLEVEYLNEDNKIIIQRTYSP